MTNPTAKPPVSVSQVVSAFDAAFMVAEAVIHAARYLGSPGKDVPVITAATLAGVDTMEKALGELRAWSAELEERGVF